MAATIAFGHGHRQARRALRRPISTAEEPGGLLPGNRPRRPRRGLPSEVLDDLRPAGRDPAGPADRRPAARPTSRSGSSGQKLEALPGATARPCGAASAGAAGVFSARRWSALRTATSCLERSRASPGLRRRRSLCRRFYRTGQRWGAAWHVIDAAEPATRTDKTRHGSSTTGCRSGVSGRDMGGGLALDRAPADRPRADRRSTPRHGTLQLTDKVRPVLRGEIPADPAPRPAAKRAGRSGAKGQPRTALADPGGGKALFQALKTWRKETRGRPGRAALRHLPRRDPLRHRRGPARVAGALGRLPGVGAT